VSFSPRPRGERVVIGGKIRCQREMGRCCALLDLSHLFVLLAGQRSRCILCRLSAAFAHIRAVRLIGKHGGPDRALVEAGAAKARSARGDRSLDRAPSFGPTQEPPDHSPSAAPWPDVLLGHDRAA